MNMRKNTVSPKFLNYILIAAIGLIVCIFLFLGKSIKKMSENTISDIGTTYMAEMSEQASLHFETVIELRFTMLESIERILSGEGKKSGAALKDVEYGARARGFEYLGFYSPDGKIEMIYGDAVSLKDPAPFLKSLNNGESKAASAADSDGKGVILFGMPCQYPMSDGEESLALVVGLTSEYMRKVLFLDEATSIINSYVIRKDGSYVIRDQEEEFRENYFERISSIYADYNTDIERNVSGLKKAMGKNEDYSAILQDGTSRQHLYCTKLPYCEWYLVTVLPFENLDSLVFSMSNRWLGMVYLACFIVIALLMLIFFQYLRLFKTQVRELESMNQEMDTARKEAEKAQKEAEHANMAKREFLSNMSHDIRTPMNAIVGMTAIAVTNIQNKDQVKECLRKITLSSKHLLGLINDVLDMSKIESGKMTLSISQISLREVMDNIVNIVQPQIKAKKQHFDIFINEIIAEDICCDSVRLNQILINLLGNAIKFTPENGSIQVTVYQEELEDDSHYVRTHFLVRDTGIGMSEEYQDKIFESFSREDNCRVQKTEGTGLGMAITKYIVDAMGGTISVESEQGKGSEFHVALDMEKAEVQEEEMLLPDWNMLVVDDDEQLCISAVSSLKSIGVNPEWCMNARDAIEMVKERHKRNEDYQVILLDWKLPDMDGIAAAREIRKSLGEDIPILLISAYDWEEIEEEARAAGVVGFISKPLFKSTLYYGLRSFAGIGGEDDTETETEPKHFELKGKRILLAEDNELNWEVARELLSALDMKLDWAENGRICVDKFEKSPVGYYDAVLMDVRMPVMDGYQATRAIRSLKRADAGIPIIAMTADAFSEDVQKCLDSGMNAHLAKPIDIQEVCHKLKKYMKHDNGKQMVNQ